MLLPGDLVRVHWHYDGSARSVHIVVERHKKRLVGISGVLRIFPPFDGRYEFFYENDLVRLSS